VPFPFTDLSETKLRPSVVLWVDNKGQDVTLCFISSQAIDRFTDDEFIILPSDLEFAQTGLKSHSKVRVARIVTLSGAPFQDKALYMPAVVSMRHNPLLKAFSERLLDRGKAQMQAIGAIMRKLVHLAFGILKSQQPFDPNYALAEPL
jgi:hypothetical protein